LHSAWPLLTQLLIISANISGWSDQEYHEDLGMMGQFQVLDEGG